MNEVADRPTSEAAAIEQTRPRPAHRAELTAALAATIAASQVACGGGGGGGPEGAVQASASATPTAPASAGTAAPTPAATPAPQPISDEQAARFLLHAQFSANDAEIVALRSAGYAGWLQAQYAQPPGPSGSDWLESRGYGAIDANRYFNASYPADYMIWRQLMTAPDAMRQRIALALSEYFVVSLNGINNAWRSQMIAAYWDLLAAGAFGNYRQLFEDVTLNAAMGSYLNTRGNQRENAATGRQPDENYARESMQLMSIGLVQLNPDGSEKTDARGAKIETYGQSDVSNLARVFTGWDFDQSRNVVTSDPNGSGTSIGNNAFARLPMALNTARHSNLAANFLGASVAAGTDGRAALKTALDTLFNHPNVGPFFGRQMIQRLTASNPSPAYVARVAAAFNDNGQGQRGDLRAVWSAILLDPEARDAATLALPTAGKLREPIQRFVQWGRSFNLRSLHGSWKIGDLSDPATRLGQSPLRAPSVFNFFRPGYVPPSTALAATGSTAPEFQIVSESSVGGYLNFMQSVIRTGIRVNAPDQPNPGSNASNGYDIVPDYGALLPVASDAAAIVGWLNLHLAAGQLSAPTRQLMVDALNATPLAASASESAKLDRIAAAVLMVMACPEYLVQK